MRRRLLAFVSLAGALACCDGDASDGAGATTQDGGPGADASPGGDGALSSATLTLAHPSAWVVAGGKKTVGFTVARNGVGGALRIHVGDLPAAVTATDVMIDDAVTTGAIELVADAAAALGAEANATVSLARGSEQQDAKPFTVRVSGNPGDLDPTWGGAGSVITDVAATEGSVIAVYPASAGPDAGKVVVAGRVTYGTNDVRIVIARYRVDGTLDPTFGDVVDGGAVPLGYTIFDPGPNSTSWPTYIGGMKLDSKGRILLTNGRYPGSHCGVELSRWTSSGQIDPSFARFSGSLEGLSCGDVNDLVVTATDDVALLGRWNEANGNVASIVQVFSGIDGARQGAGFHLFLDTSGGEKSTRGFGLAVDAESRFVVVGQQCDGGWVSQKYTCSSMIARLTVNGAPDATFGAKQGWASFDFGSPPSATSAETFRRGVIDPTTGDIIAVGANEGGSFVTLVRLKAVGGTPAAFGADGTLTRDVFPGASGEVLLRPHVDSEGRIVFTGVAVTGSDVTIVTGRTAADGTYDTTYGGDGIATTPGRGLESAIASDDRLYVVGTENAKMKIWRFWP